MSEPGATIELSRSGFERPVQGFRLEVRSGPDQGKVFVPASDVTVIGTHENAQLRLQDPAVSRFHVELTAEDGAVSIRDLRSRNGVLVDGVRITSAYLHDGALLAIGQSTLAFTLDARPMHIPFSSKDTFGLMVGRSVAMRRAFSLLERAATSNATVLLGGETGTGKEAAAESIHLESARGKGPFIVVDCGAIPGNLLESELFGHEKGAFTGAERARAGAFEEANGGTLFLDEIGELDPDLQPKLLRVLEKREIKRVGSSKYMPIDVRIIAATHRNLRAEVNAKTFRSDLFYRLAVVEVALPALRERLDDLPLLVTNILDRLGETDSPASQIVRTPEFFATLGRHVWPGNVRELRNYVERCLALGEKSPLGDGAETAGGPGLAADAPFAVDTKVSLKRGRDTLVAAFERAYLEKILAEHGGNVSAAARAAGVDRIHFYRLLWRSGLK
jgi:transcriptional regulator with PAS, ATPase and Fis domain